MAFNGLMGFSHFLVLIVYRYSQLKSESSSKIIELEQMNKNLSEKNEYIESFQKVCAYLFLVNKEV